ncbi:MAG: lysophospholipid acyltransferase family protein [Bacteroidales bacterium]|jgi:1-acyl-sn-glycerol-3-phosphate acyltransferase
MRARFQKLFARICLLITGWKLEGMVPDLPRCVIIGAPHTSNWDFFFGMLYKFYYGLNIHFLIKRELFRFPFRWVFRYIGGIPVDRRKHDHLVDKFTEKMKHSGSFYLAIAPEGSRKEVMVWKRGFYHIAKKAGVPIVLGYMDYRRKVVGVGPVFYPGDDIEKDMREIALFYSTIQAKFPGNFYLPVDRHKVA